MLDCSARMDLNAALAWLTEGWLLASHCAMIGALEVVTFKTRSRAWGAIAACQLDISRRCRSCIDSALLSPAEDG